MKPLVGITGWMRYLDTFYGPDTLQTLSTYYSDSVANANMTPLIFPSSLAPEEANRLVEIVDAVVISGGDDVDPASYGAENTDSKTVSRAADDFEVAVAAAAQQQNKPVLAICRGLQILNVALGGTLAQEVTSPGGVHDLVTKDHVEMNARRHVVSFEADSILAEMYGSSEAKVNTLHHQGVEQLADTLVVEGRTDDGLIEAARYKGDWWALAVQWHPERLEGSHQKIFELLREVVTG